MKLKIKTHSGDEYITEVEKFNPVEINEQINRSGVITVLIGDKILAPIDIKSVVPVEVPPTEEEPVVEEPPSEEPTVEEPSVEEDPAVDEPPIEDETPVEPTE